MKTSDLHWLAGLIEGEGCIGKAHKRPRFTPCITVAMTDRDVILRVAELFKRKIYEAAPPNRKRIFSTRVSGAEAIAWMMTLYSLMGERRKARIREAIAEWKSRPKQRRIDPVKRTCRMHGSEHLVVYRNGRMTCRECHRQYAIQRKARA